jgi:hypothetical protein
MLLACVLFALITVGLVVPCVIDVVTSPAWAIRTLSKPTWLLVMIVFSVFGCTAWLIAGRPRRMPLVRRAPSVGISPAEAFRRHPAGRAMGFDLDTVQQRDVARGPRPARPLGPDDDLEFLQELERRINESRDDR